MDRLRTMKMFVSVVDEGGFASASRACDVAPAIVTRMIADLEAHLGARLINRTTRRISLTPIGEEYLNKARGILANVEEAESLVSSAHAEPQGSVRLKVPASFAVHQVAKVLPTFASSFPKVSVEVTTSSGDDDSVDEGHDLTIVARREELTGDFVARRLARTELVLCAAPSYLDRQGRPRHPGQLGSHRMLMPPRSLMSQSFVFYNTEVEKHDPAHEVSVRSLGASTLTTASDDLTYAAALAGLGVCGLPSFIVEDAVAEHALERVLPEWRLFHFTLWLCMPSRKHVPARTRALSEYLMTTFGGRDRDPWLPVPACATPRATSWEPSALAA